MFYEKSIMIGNMKINLHLWDTNNRKDQCTHTNTQIYVNHPKQKITFRRLLQFYYDNRKDQCTHKQTLRFM